MTKARNPNRDKAFEVYKNYHGRISNREIAKILNEKDRNISYWKSADKWKIKYNPKGGAPIGNQNAVGHKGATLKGNQNARKEGWYSKYFPVESRNIIKELQDAQASPLEILWAQIVTQWAVIIRSQNIMYVKDKDDMAMELKKKKESYSDKGGGVEEEWEIQFAWDRQATFLNAQSRAMSELRSLIKQYDEMLNKDWDMATEEQKLRIEKLRIDLENPDLKHRKEIANKKLALEREKLDHVKKMDEIKNW